MIQSKDSVFYLDLSGILEIKCSLLMRYGLIVRFFNSLTHKVGIKILPIIFFLSKNTCSRPITGQILCLAQARGSEKPVSFFSLYLGSPKGIIYIGHKMGSVNCIEDMGPA